MRMARIAKKNSLPRRGEEVLVKESLTEEETRVVLLSYVFQVGKLPISLRCKFLRAGIEHRPFEISYHHPHPAYSRLFLFRRGGAAVTVAGKHCILTEGRVYLLPANQDFHITYSPSDLFFFHLAVNDEVGLSVFNDVRGVVYLEGGERIFDDIIWSFGAGHEFERYMIAFRAICQFVEPIKEDLRKRALWASRYSSVISLLRERPLSQARISDIAASVGMSRSALSKGFQRQAGISLKSYIIQLHIDRAKDLLASTDKTVEQIAYDLGYSEPSYFHRVFRRHIGHTPRAYRSLVQSS
jgi:AraC-like DNA-binding protein/mannose-6-phosphate isomerase-like protein (cupin superfamily)